MPVTVLVLYLLYIAVAVGLRVAIHLRHTGSTGIKSPGRPGSLEWWAGLGFVGALVGSALAPTLELAGRLQPLPALATPWVQAAGYACFLVGLVATFLCQLAMGKSWRIGVDASEQTDLVTAGPFAYVRNPIFTATLLAIGGLALLLPDWLALASWLALWASLEVQTRCVEEPYLAATHGQAYRAYAGRVGRFLPGLGRLG